MVTYASLIDIIKQNITINSIVYGQKVPKAGHFINLKVPKAGHFIKGKIPKARFKSYL